MTAEPWRLPRRRDALSYWLRTRLLSLRALVLQAWSGADVRWPAAEALADAPVVAEHRSPLWTEGDDAEFVLTAGKVENLRRAIAAFQSVEVPAGGVLSFWAQLGRPSARRGFVVGREIREGCVVPTVAGGICQLSNALADVAARAGLEFVERHGHSARVGNGSPQSADATVFWRHIDLKLRSRHAWRLDVEMTDVELVVKLRSHAPRGLHAIAVMPRRELAVARGCLGCEESQCFRHARHLGLRGQQERAAALLDAWTPEFSEYLATQQSERFAPVPLRLAFWRRRDKAWTDATWLARWASLRGALWRRIWARRGGGRRQSAVLDTQRWLAEAYAAALTPLHTRLIVDQALLPHLELRGALAGREIEVLAHALPFGEIHARLDRAVQRWPEEETLRDFRAPCALVEAEARGLARARRLVTAHADVAAVLSEAHGGKLVQLAWAEAPVRAAPANTGPSPLLLFAAPALARKGALELAAALRGLDCGLRTLGRPEAAAWPGVRLDTSAPVDPFDGVAAVVLPAHVEHAPRLLLSALARGLPVIATPACGLAAQPGLHLVDAGDVAGLRAALVAVLDSMPR
jgi:hypothetical protein